MKRRAYSYGGAILCLLLLVSCDQRPELLKTKVAALTEGLSQDFEAIRAATVGFVKEAEQVYGHLDQYDLSTRGMDVKDGGIFETFTGNKYYYKTVAEGVSVYASPQKPVSDDIRREVKIQLQLEPAIKASFDAKPELLNGSFFGVHEPISIAILYPFQDVVSHLPPGLDFRVLEWYTRGLNSSGQTLWSKGPFISLYGGWVEDLAAPVTVNGRILGVQVMIVGMDKVKAKYLANETDNLLLLGPDLTLVAASAPAQKAMHLKVLEDVDYVKQLKENSFAAAVYQLSDPSQSEGIRAVASKIAAGEASFDVAIDGANWQFVVGNVRETGFYTVGFLKK